MLILCLEQDREENALTLFAEARDMAMSALAQLENFTDANLEVVLFSGEGDALHQVFLLPFLIRFKKHTG